MDDKDRKVFLQILAKAIPEFRLRLIAYCLMENHYHLFLQTLNANLQLAMKLIQEKYAQYINFRYSRVGPLFQGRYKSRLVDTTQYALVLTRYIHQNPLDAKLVQHLADYPWSSYPNYTGKLPQWSWLDTEWLLRQLNDDPQIACQYFIEFHSQTPSPSEIRVLASNSSLT